MARREHIHLRLLNWARWTIGGQIGSLGYASVQLNAVSTRASYREATVPILDAEAAETGAAVASLERPLRLTIELIYIRATSIRGAAAALCCAESTVHARTAQAHHQIDVHLQALRAAKRSERARVEALQRTRHPHK